MRAGGNIEEHHFVRALLVITNSEFHRISHVAELAGLSLAELHPAGDLSGMNIKAWNDTFGQHFRRAKIVQAAPGGKRDVPQEARVVWRSPPSTTKWKSSTSNALWRMLEKDTQFERLTAFRRIVYLRR